MERQPGADGEWETSPRRRRGWSRVRRGPLVLLVVFGGLMLWASRQDGGVGGTFERMGDYVEGRLDDFTENADAEAAIEYLNERYTSEGAYPRLNASTIGEIDALGVAGLDVATCSRHHVVVESLTARGTVSHLLVAGEAWGRVQGAQPCPADLSNPAPWTVPDIDPTD